MDDLDAHLQANEALVDQRLEMGDLAEVPRQLDHFALFPRRAVDAAVAELTSAGFTVDGVRRGLRRARVEFSRTDRADFATADAFTRQIVGLTSRHGGTYDGWAGFIVTDAPA
ncbi:ribonuclease E inhibitor RraB [Aquipuribacter hungaricus]|uniref:Ribonuclease E inhibitor RraB n=1 Tax=Aquipuribacter hungaricus TaxID=545624 RepID=A0ABV7WBA4_9MICO